ncbi:MAG: hypothetical protein AMDU4_FER2C00003G0024 [Ferroplasma sp. Type II]|jgi:hypothetical protein|uniref:NYN domain-containing protein n=1 Tax=Ferroplasma sp. Type II TaxID=261388 RepID=UPI0003896DBD|nr:hypothetical protein [Ferroplasma sp. Type II]EQB74579.1 MAG: hypothetical protein AMDU4_FER2C00003G0024 [Ferroplasma sp. Type II]HIH59788.1 hypothetical protein [Ferroplasma sp.]
MYENKISGSTVIIDGSNVALYGLKNSQKKKAVLNNILEVINKLKALKASEIITICDANIRYLIDDTEKFNQMVANRTLIISPSGIKADTFILDYAREKNCLIVSNDKFRDYRDDNWIGKNIDNITLGFIFVGNDVMLEPVNGNKKLKKKTIEKKQSHWWHFFKNKQ